MQVSNIESSLNFPLCFLLKSTNVSLGLVASEISLKYDIIVMFVLSDNTNMKTFY